MITIFNSYLAEVNFATAPAAGSRTYFLDIPQLRGKRTVGIECISATQLSTSPNNKTTVSQTNAATVLLTLSVGEKQNVERVYWLPATSLIASLNGGFIRQFGDLPINLVKSYLTVTAAGISAAQSLMFNFIYK